MNRQTRDWLIDAAITGALVVGVLILAGLALTLIGGVASAQDPEVVLEPPPFFYHPLVAPGQVDPYRGKCRRPDGADCCASVHCAPVPSDDLGRIQLEPGGTFVDPHSLMPRPNICDSSDLPPLYNALDHACDGPMKTITCVFLRSGSV